MGIKFSEQHGQFLDDVSKQLNMNLKVLNFQAYRWPNPLRHNWGVKIERIPTSPWRIGGCSLTNKQVDIHFEAITSGELQLDVEVYPYEPNIDVKRKEELEALNLPKAGVMIELRDLLLNNQILKQRFGVNKRHFLDAQKPNACGAVRFIHETDDGFFVKEYVSFCCEVISVVSPIIDKWLLANKGRWLPTAGHSIGPN